VSENPGRSESTHVRIQLPCAWCIPAFIIIYPGAFIGLSGFVPPPSPRLTAANIAVLFAQHRNAIVGGHPTSVVALGSMALAGFLDKRAQPIFPRGFCFFTLWVALARTGGGFATFFKTGPFAWDGMLAFWAPVALYLAWRLVLFPLLIRLVKRAAFES
jgi:hypothetical protein